MVRPACWVYTDVGSHLCGRAESTLPFLLERNANEIARRSSCFADCDEASGLAPRWVGPVRRRFSEDTRRERNSEGKGKNW
jgi:hypothetical protein